MSSDDQDAQPATADELETDVGRLRLFLWACLWGDYDKHHQDIVSYFEELGWVERLPHGFKSTPAAPKGGE